jgi:spore maturation protein A
MVMGYIWTGMAIAAMISAAITGQGSALAAAVPQGAQAGITLAISIAGSICLWSGVGKLMERCGIMDGLTKVFRPVLNRLFPSGKNDRSVAGHLSANICANFLGLGNAATPMGILAAQGLAKGRTTASNELCRLIVLNTASIQLIPANVAAVRTGLGCTTPFDILPAVWITSLCSAGMGLLVAFLFGRIWK